LLAKLGFKVFVKTLVS